MVDPYWPLTSLAFHFDGANGESVTRDLTQKVITSSAGTALSTAQSAFGWSSLYLNGSSHRLVVGATETGLNASTAFTVECWIYPLVVDRRMTLISRYLVFSAGWYFNVLANGSLSFRLYVNGSDNGFTSPTGLIAANVWTHVAATIDGNTVRLFVDGALVATNTFTGGINALANRDMWIGGDIHNTIDYFSGYIDDLRITQGIARYTEAFPKPTAPFDHVTFADMVGAFVSPSTHLSVYSPPTPAAWNSADVAGNYDYWYGGRGRIAATTKIKGSPDTLVSRRVRLHEQRTGNFVKETWSDDAGNYVFDYIDPRNKYYAVAFDHTGFYQGVIADQLVPEIF